MRLGVGLGRTQTGLKGALFRLSIRTARVRPECVRVRCHIGPHRCLRMIQVQCRVGPESDWAGHSTDGLEEASVPLAAIFRGLRKPKP